MNYYCHNIVIVIVVSQMRNYFVIICKSSHYCCYIGLTKIDDLASYQPLIKELLSRSFILYFCVYYIILYIRYNICLRNLINLTTIRIHLLLPIDYGFGCNKSLT